MRLAPSHKTTWFKFGINAENAWVGVIDDERVSLWAGAAAGDSSQGLIYAMVAYPYRNWDVRVATNEHHGLLHSVSDRANRLELWATDGTVFYFDVPGFSVVSNLDAIASTATPPPTFTPAIR